MFSLNHARDCAVDCAVDSVTITAAVKDPISRAVTDRQIPRSLPVWCRVEASGGSATPLEQQDVNHGGLHFLRNGRV